jgi:hypothetical protein
MSLIRSCLIISAAIMLLPLDEKKQTDFAATASHTAQETASYCERNPATCQAGRELWSTFVRKAEYGMELGARLAREQFLRAMTESREQAPPPAAHAVRGTSASTATPRTQPPVAQSRPRTEPPVPAVGRQEGNTTQARQQHYSMDYPSRWR